MRIVQNKKRGAALVVVLSLVVLLSFLVVSYLTSSQLDRRSTRNYSQSVRAQDLAMGALQEIADDLKQEIDAGSRQDPAYTINGKRVYLPASRKSALPGRIGFTSDQFGTPTPANELLPFNLIRVSRASDPFFSLSETADYPGVLPPNRASNVKSTDRSANNRFFPAERWNKPQLMGAVNGSDPGKDLIPPSNFTAAPPDWVYVTRGGSKVFQGTSADIAAMKLSKNPDEMDAVLGRYAFVMYEVGGLLDMNAAGHPSALGSTPEGADAVRFKSASAYADLACIPGLSGKEVLIDGLLDWRSNGSLAALGNHSFAKMVEKLQPSGFLSNQTGDNPFVSRQDMIEYLRTRLGTTEPLPYLGAFARSVNAPSWMPETPIGAIRDYVAEADSAVSANRNLANVRFRKPGPVKHYDDIYQESIYDVEAGDPLLQTRFSLAKLAWLSGGNPDTGVGPAENSEIGRAIKSSFGLVWDYPGANSGQYSANGGNKCWTYVGSTGSAGIFPGTIQTLDEVAQENREPNFFELLKAAILSGSLGKSAGIALYNNTARGAASYNGGNAYTLPLGSADAAMAGGGGLYDEWLDYGGRTVPAPARISDMQILQIGANIIDQGDADSWPTAIYFKYAGVDTFDPAGADGHPLLGPVTLVFGQENLPYLTRLAQLNCSPARTGSGASGTDDDATTVLAGWRQPELWNPYQEPTSTSVVPPKTFQIRAYGASQTYFNHTSLPSPIAGSWPPGYYGGSTASPAHAFWGRASGLSNAVRYFTTNSATETSDVGTIDITDNNASSALRAHPVLTATGIANVDVSSPAAVRADPPSGDNVAKPHYPYFDEIGNPTWNPRTNHFVAFATGETVKTPANRINSGPDKLKQPFWVWRSSVNVGSNGVDIGYGDTNSYALGWVDGGGKFHPYSFITGVFPHSYCVLRRSDDPAKDSRVGQVQFENRSFNYNMWTRADPRTSRFSTQVKAFGAGDPPGNNTLFPKSGVNWGFGKDTRPVGVGFNYPATVFNCRDWAINAASSIHGTAFSGAFYADPDGIVRPGDGIFASVITGDGMMLFTAAAAPTGAGIAEGDSAGNTRHGRRPVILNRPFRTVGELGYAFRDLPFKSLDFFTTLSADAGLLDVFCVADTAVVKGGSLRSVTAGQINPNTAPQAVLRALLSGGSKKALDAAYNFSDVQSDTIARNIVNMVNPPASAPEPFMNPAALVLLLGSNPSNGSGPVRNALTSSPDKGNKAYLESAPRILSGTTGMRTWNLMIDVVAQSGRMSPLANTLDDFLVEGEKRYWLHLAIDRYSGDIIDQQLEAVNE